ncbi:MAG: carboxypeptidase-like regulatory domain-containing protein [Candidatus Eremiobacteraeota bacterium]|nr:carboxypeptidase-like regulatory domain-containing protein [Candidatus Eremiobacteraeota bacterium]
MKPLAAAILGLAVLPSFASAEIPATIRGVVYSCDTGAPIAGAYVWLRGLDAGSVNTLWTDARGGFARVGMAPGRYIVFVGGPVQGSKTIHARPASRMARVDTDDVLDLRLGTQLIAVAPRPDVTSISNAHVTRAMYEAQPICDAPLVPLAPPTTDRYVIH